MSLELAPERFDLFAGELKYKNPLERFEITFCDLHRVVVASLGATELTVENPLQDYLRRQKSSCSAPMPIPSL